MKAQKVIGKASVLTFLNPFFWLPIWLSKQRLFALALNTPNTALKFAVFLRTYFPLKTKLADCITHAVLAGNWLHNPLQVEVLEEPIIELEKLKPSVYWFRQLNALKKQLLSFQQQSNTSLKQQQGLKLLNELEKFKIQNLVENSRWRDYYLKAIELWLKVANEQLKQLKLQALSHEPITANVYLSGDPLNPKMHNAVFMGRDDLKDQFARKVHTATQMPMFVIQAQRRTGKTSLLNFLEPLLGTGFRVIKLDMQDAEFHTIPRWLAGLHQRITSHLDTSQPKLIPSENWLQGWQTVQTSLSQFSDTSHYKLILAFDEYEAIHTLLQQDPAQGERLLAAMRSFSQSQNKVVFLFVGAALLSELEQPNWSSYFVQAQRFRLDYLKHDDAIRLITDPVKLNYPPTVCEQMFELTQGHPALLQLLCSKMVYVANTENKKDMSQADLDAVVQDVSTERETSAILIFWKDFCADPACKQTVKQILNGETIEPNQHLYHLEEHGFIVEQNGRWQMRVPLFTLWLKRFAERVV